LRFDSQETLSVNLQDSSDRAIFVVIHREDTDQSPGIVGDVLYEFLGQTLTPGSEVPLFMDAWLKTTEKILNGNCNPVISADVLSFAYGYCEKKFFCGP